MVSRTLLKAAAYWLIAQAAGASRSHHCSGLIDADRLRDEASDLGKIRELDATAH
jgi:hypothetical protein